MNLNVSPGKFIENNAPTLAVITILLVGVGIGLTQTGFDVPGLTASITGSQLCGVSTDQVRISSNSPEISGKTWVIQSIAGCGDHKITGGWKFDSENIQGTTSSGEKAKATKDFEIALTDFQGWVENSIQSDPSARIYTAKYNSFPGSGVGGVVTESDIRKCHQWQADNSESLDALDLPDRGKGVDEVRHEGFITYSEGYVDVSQTLHCYRAQNMEGTIHDIRSSSILDWTGTFKMDVEGSGDPATKVVTKEQAQGGVTLSEGGHSAHIQYTGSMLNRVLDVNLGTRWKAACNNNCNQPQNSRSYLITANSLVTDYRQSVRGFRTTVLNSIDNGAPQAAVDSHNSQVNNVFSGQSQALADDVGNWVSKVTIQEGAVRIQGEDSDILGRPSFTFRIDADWLGFEIPVAKPQIQSATDVSIDALGSGSSTRITVQNTADVGGTVHTSVSCPSPLQAGYDEGYIRAGGIQAFNVNIQSGPSPDNTYTCDVRVKDKDARQVQDTATISVDVASSCTDSDGDTVCDQNDGCVNQPGPVSNGGCPTGPNDSDSDGVNDAQDQCPTRSQTPQDKLRQFDTSGETYNGVQDSDGCPDKIKNPNEETKCSDGLDNDGDGLIDDADPNCVKPGGTPWGWIIAGILGLVMVGGTLFYFRKPIKQKLKNFGAGQ